MTGLKIPAGLILQGSVFGAASTLQDREYLRRTEQLSVERVAKKAPAPAEPQAIAPSSSRRAKR